MTEQRTRWSVGLLLVALGLLTATAGGSRWFQGANRETEPTPGEVTIPRARVRGHEPATDEPPLGRATDRAASTTFATERDVGPTDPKERERAPDRSTFAALRPGLCAGRDAGWERSRAQYLATFVDANVAAQGTYNARLLVAPGTLPDVLLGVGRELNTLGTRIQDELGLPVEAATLYLYPTLEALHEHACVHPSAIAYYDGAIHLAPPAPRSAEWNVWPHQTLRHEYVHHVLLSAGVGAPFWFQEGVAMQMAPDNPRASDFPTEALPLFEMVGALDHSSADDSVLQRYAQSFLMVVFLRSICPYTGINEGAMARALLGQVVEPRSLFDWALQQCAQDLDEDPRALWANYASTRRLSEAIRERVRRRLVGAASTP